MPFDLTPNIHVRRDQTGTVRHPRHPQQPYVSPAVAEPQPLPLAAEYVREVASIYGVDPALLANLTSAPPNELTPAGPELRFAGEKTVLGTVTLSFSQTQFGIPIWEAGVSVTTQPSPRRVTSS